MTAPKHKGDGNDPAAKKAAREREIQRQKEYPHYCMWAPCRRRFKTKAELDEHTESCRHVLRGKRPKAPAGKECPECKVIVERKGRGKTARLICICTPESGVPAEVAS